MKIKDLHTSLDTEIDIQERDINTTIKVKEKLRSSTQDLFVTLKKIDLRKIKEFKVLKNNTKNFDSFLNHKKLKNISLVNPPKFDYKKYLVGSPFGEKPIFLQQYFLKNTAVCIACILFLAIADKYAVEYFINSGYNKITSIKDQTKTLDGAKLALNDAKLDFIIGDFLFTPFSLLPGKHINAAYHIIKGGKEITKFGDDALSLYTGVTQLVEEKGANNIYITNLLKNQRENFQILENRLHFAYSHYGKIGKLGNAYLDEKIAKNRQRLEKIIGYMNTVNTNFDDFINIMGASGQRKYLVVFQNNDEIRPTGGFMGSSAIITVSKGKISNFEKSDIYAYEWKIDQLKEKKALAPEGLNKITPTLGIRDANYYIDTKRSSDTIKGFLNRIDIEIDGIMYINQDIILDILALIGGVKLEGYNETITAENFSHIISIIVEAKLTKVGTLGTPKKVLFDFQDAFFKKIISEKNYFGYANILLNSILSGDTFFYSFIHEENKVLEKLQLTGKNDYFSSLDFSYPVFTSISGNKSDRYMKITYNKNVKQNADCSIDTNLKIYTKHAFSNNNERELIDLISKYKIKDKPKTLFIQGRGPNYQYMRVLLPKEAIIKNKSGLQIDNHEYIKVVSWYNKTERTETTSKNIIYTLPNKRCKDYSYKLYKQPGITDYSINFSDNINTLELDGIKKDFFYNYTK